MRRYRKRKLGGFHNRDISVTFRKRQTLSYDDADHDMLSGERCCAVCYAVCCDARKLEKRCFRACSVSAARFAVKASILRRSYSTRGLQRKSFTIIWLELLPYSTFNLIIYHLALIRSCHTTAVNDSVYSKM